MKFAEFFVDHVFEFGLALYFVYLFVVGIIRETRRKR